MIGTKIHKGCGLRVSDVLTLQWKNIDWEKKELKKTLVKGKVPHRIALTDNAMKILEKWQVKGYSERFVFAMLPDAFNLSDDKVHNPAHTHPLHDKKSVRF